MRPSLETTSVTITFNGTPDGGGIGVIPTLKVKGIITVESVTMAVVSPVMGPGAKVALGTPAQPTMFAPPAQPPMMDKPIVWNHTSMATVHSGIPQPKLDDLSDKDAKVRDAELAKAQKAQAKLSDQDMSMSAAAIANSLTDTVIGMVISEAPIMSGSIRIDVAWRPVSPKASVTP